MNTPVTIISRKCFVFNTYLNLHVDNFYFYFLFFIFADFSRMSSCDEKLERSAIVSFALRQSRGRLMQFNFSQSQLPVLK
jgi:hypothetical protein